MVSTECKKLGKKTTCGHSKGEEKEFIKENLFSGSVAMETADKFYSLFLKNVCVIFFNVFYVFPVSYLDLISGKGMSQQEPKAANCNKC